MSALAVAPVYEPPALAWAGEPATEQPWVLFVVFTFTYLAALAWAAYCISRGGSPEIEFEWWRWRITCRFWGSTGA